MPILHKAKFKLYYLPYAIILYILFFAMNFFLQDEYKEYIVSTHNTQVGNIINTTVGSLENVFQTNIAIDYSIRNDSIITNSNYSNATAYDTMIVCSRLREYMSLSSTIDDIIIYNSNSQILISTLASIKNENQIVGYYTSNGQKISIDTTVTPNRIEKLTYCSQQDILSYVTRLETASIFPVYIINLSEIRKILSTGVVEGISNIILLNNTNEVLLSANEIDDSYIEYFDNETYNMSSNQDDDRYQLEIYNISDICRALIIIDTHYVSNQIEPIFDRMYLLQFLFIFLIISAIYLGLKFHFLPIKRLVSYIRMNDYEIDNFEDIIVLMNQAEEKNNLLSTTLNNYRITTQKAILGEVATHTHDFTT